MDFVLQLEPDGATPLHQQLCDGLRRAILSGRLRPGQRLPSSRALAGSLRVSRSTVTLCYETLISEGYLDAAQGSGTFVCQQLPEALLRAAPAARDGYETHRRAVRLSAFGQAVAAPPAPRAHSPASTIDFGRWRPDLDSFPHRVWSRLVARQLRARHPAMFDYSSESRGYRPLREAIAEYLARARAVRCDPDQVIVVNGSQQALALIARVLLERGDEVAVEEPGYLGARHVFRAHGAVLRPLCVDGSGLVTDALHEKPPPRLVYVTPSHQFPTGAVLSLARRLELLSWAAETGTLLVEDDYDSEYRYGGRPAPALQGLDTGGAVLYVGTFSKVLFPALRVGYLVVPPDLAPVLARAKWLEDRQCPLLEQYVLTDFVREGHLERHIRRMRTLYERRRGALMTALEDHFHGRLTVFGEPAGMHVMVRLDTGLPDPEVNDRAANSGVSLVSATPYYLEAGGEGAFVFGFSHLSERRIQTGIKRLAKALTVG